MINKSQLYTGIYKEKIRARGNGFGSEISVDAEPNAIYCKFHRCSTVRFFSLPNFKVFQTNLETFRPIIQQDLFCFSSNTYGTGSFTDRAYLAVPA
jgi:hypothetical protein